MVGFANGEIPRLALNLPLIKGASIIGVLWGEFVRREPEAYRRDLQTMFGMIATGALRPRISASYSLADAWRALEALERRQVTGKAVIVNR